MRCFTPAFLKASLAGERAEAARELGVQLPDDWPDNSQLLVRRLKELRADPTLQSWLLRGMCHRELKRLIGYLGFHTAPGAEYLDDWAPGGVEFGFSVFPGFRRQGYARESAEALMQWAHHEHAVTRFVLTIAPDNTASHALAAQLGFTRIGSQIDEIDGEEDVLAREYPADNA